MKMSEKETMKSEIIKYAMSKIGTKRVSTLDGMTLEYKNKYYNIYVDDNNVTVEEIEDENEDFDEHKEISDVENVCGDCSHFNACMQDYETNASTCCMFDSLNKAITNPEWHHVSLATLTNLDFDMLDRKRQVYLKAHRELKRTLADLSKCKTEHTYEVRARKFFRDMKSKYYSNVISHEMRKYLDLQISMSNVINGVWSSYVEAATGCHESRRYNKM